MDALHRSGRRTESNYQYRRNSDAGRKSSFGGRDVSKQTTLTHQRLPSHSRTGTNNSQPNYSFSLNDRYPPQRQGIEEREVASYPLNYHQKLSHHRDLELNNYPQNDHRYARQGQVESRPINPSLYGNEYECFNTNKILPAKFQSRSAQNPSHNKSVSAGNYLRDEQAHHSRSYEHRSPNPTENYNTMHQNFGEQSLQPNNVGVRATSHRRDNPMSSNSPYHNNPLEIDKARPRKQQSSNSTPPRSSTDRVLKSKIYRMNLRR